jgi:hypothetical protein
VRHEKNLNIMVETIVIRRVLNLEVKEINSVDEFYGMRSEWNKVLNEISDNTFFLSWERMAPGVKYLDQGSTLKILCATDGEEILGIAPLRKSRYFYHGHSIYNVIESLNYRALGILLAKRKVECLNMFLTHLYNQKDWDFLYFNDVPETFSIVDLLKKNSHSIPDFEVKEGDASPYLTIPGSLDELLKGLDSTFRRNLLRCMRKLEKDHRKVTLVDYCELGSLEEGLQIFFDLHQKRWISNGGPGAFQTKRNRDMFLYEARLFSEINCLRLHFLMANDKPIAVLYGFEYEQVLYAMMSGFDPAYASYSPFSLLILKTLKRCIEEGIKEFNFFGGYTSYKFKWCKTYRRNFTFRFVNRRLSSRALNLGIHIVRKLRQ